jgi:hypothetical protein
MALLNTHPDYLIKPKFFAIYEDFLKKMKNKNNNYWHVLPREIAHWWRLRNSAIVKQENNEYFIQPSVPKASIGIILMLDNRLDIKLQSFGCCVSTS